MYDRLHLLKENYRAILTGILSGVAASLLTVLALALLFGLTRAEYVTLLPKSVTTAIGMGVAEELGGHSEIAAAVINASTERRQSLPAPSRVFYSLLAQQANRVA